MEHFDVTTGTSTGVKKRRHDLHRPTNLKTTSTSDVDVDMEIPSVEEKDGGHEDVGDGFVRLLPPYPRNIGYDVKRLIFPIWAIDHQRYQKPCVFDTPPVLIRPSTKVKHIDVADSAKPPTSKRLSSTQN